MWYALTSSATCFQNSRWISGRWTHTADASFEISAWGGPFRSANLPCNFSSRNIGNTNALNHFRNNMLQFGGLLIIPFFEFTVTVSHGIEMSPSWLSDRP